MRASGAIATQPASPSPAGQAHSASATPLQDLLGQGLELHSFPSPPDSAEPEAAYSAFYPPVF